MVRTSPQTPAALHPWAPNKVVGISEAMASVRDSDQVAVGGMGLYRRPIAAILEVVRQGRRDLKLLDYIGAFEGDILIGAGCVGEVRSCYFGLDVLGLAPMYRRDVHTGDLVAILETEATVVTGLRAHLAGVDFMPARIFAGTDVLELRPDLRSVTSPFSGTNYVAVPAIAPDVAIVHTLMSDETGNCVLGSNLNLDRDLAAAAATTIVTTERVVAREAIEERGADIVGAWVDHVVHTPGGAYPTSCPPDYSVDLAFLADYVDACRSDRFGAFLEDRLLTRGQEVS